MNGNRMKDAMKVPDWRHISNGLEIPTEYYSDQPYAVKTEDGAWLCAVTTGAGVEGEIGQHIVAMRSTDRGKSWSEPVDIEPADGPEASYSVLLQVPGGRIYCFYNHNTDNIREVLCDACGEWAPDGKCRRVDSLGHHVFKFSDDHGRTWSEKRYDVPIRETEMDRNNVYGGKIKFFWNVGKPFIKDGAAFISLHKVGGFGHGFFTSSEGVLLKSSNLLTEKNPEKIQWELLPDGEMGLRTPPGGGKISEEHSYCVLSDGSLYCVYRTIDGHPVNTYSRDGGHTWSVPQYKKYADGRRMKHPRAANFAWKCENGKYIYWFHNHGGTWYEDRNPVWICGGIEQDGPDGKIIAWTQPEILLYDDDTYIRMSYPDLVEEEGRYFITETQKDMARTHEIPKEFLERLWKQFSMKGTAQRGLILELKPVNAKFQMPELPVFLERDYSRADYGTKDLRKGFTIDLWVEFSNFEEGLLLLDTRKDNGQGLCIRSAEQGRIEISLNDGRTENRWTSDISMLQTGTLHHIAVVVDGGPKIITFFVDGVLCDGGNGRQFGWGRFSPNLRHANGSETATVGIYGSASVKAVKIYKTALTTTEVIGNYRAGF